MTRGDTGHLPTPEELKRSGETLNETGVEVVPRQAATVILLRGGCRTRSRCCSSSAPTRRASWPASGSSPAARSTPHEGEGDAAHRRAAVRELEEEAAVGGVDPAALVKFSQWITPKEVSIRFDTHFFLAPAPGRRRAPSGRRRVHRPGLDDARRPRWPPTRRERTATGLPDDQAPRAVLGAFASAPTR